MPRKKKPQNPGWKDVGEIIDEFDREQLIDIIHDLYRLSSDNQDFFFARFSIGEDPLASYKQNIQNSIHPYLEGGETLDIGEASIAVDRYCKAIDNPAGEAELRTFYVECGTNFTLTYGDLGEEFYDELVEMYELAAETVLELPSKEREKFRKRLQKVMESASGIGWGFYDGLFSAYEDAFSGD